MVRNWQFFAACGWAFLAVVLLLRTYLLDAEAINRLPVRNWTVASVLCGFFALWNLARWFQHRAAAAEMQDISQNALRPNPNAKRDYEYNPEFDFQKPEPERKPNDSN